MEIVQASAGVASTIVFIAFGVFAWFRGSSAKDRVVRRAALYVLYVQAPYAVLCFALLAGLPPTFRLLFYAPCTAALYLSIYQSSRPMRKKLSRTSDRALVAVVAIAFSVALGTPLYFVTGATYVGGFVVSSVAFVFSLYALAAAVSAEEGAVLPVWGAVLFLYVGYAVVFGLDLTLSEETTWFSILDFVTKSTFDLVYLWLAVGGAVKDAEKVGADLWSPSDSE